MAGGHLIPGSQYGEDFAILKILGNRRSGIALDVGAADGYHHSNVYKLITEYGWSAVLVEPHPALVTECAKRYAGNGNVHVVHSAVKASAGKCVLHLYEPTYYGQVSTTNEEFRAQVVTQHGDQYTKDVAVPCDTTKAILNRFMLARVDFVNIDCEGAEVEALQTFPWEQRPELFVVEMAMNVEQINGIFTDNGYKQLPGLQPYRNAFFVPEENYAEDSRRINS